eukprot:Nk52_evm7s268 gene=Nk52_evmTU7s268
MGSNHVLATVIIASCVFLLGVAEKKDNPAADHEEWTVKMAGGKLPSPRYGQAMCRLKGKLYLSFGYAYDHEKNKASIKSELLQYSFSRDEWKEILVKSEKRPEIRYEHTMVSDGDQNLILFGGQDGGFHRESPTFLWGSSFNEVWTFNIHSGRWMNLTLVEGSVVPKARHGHTAHFINGRMYIFGGLVSNGLGMKPVETNELWAFSLKKRLWNKVGTTEKATPLPRAFHASAFSKNNIYIHGGVSVQDKRAYHDMWKFDTLAMSWELIWFGSNESPDSFPEGRSGHGIGIFNEHVYAFHGALCIQRCVCFNDTWRFDINNARWTKLSVGTVHDTEARHSLNTKYKFSLVGIGGDFENVRNIESSDVRDCDNIDSKRCVFVMTGGESYSPYRYYSDTVMLSTNELFGKTHTSHSETYPHVEVDIAEVPRLKGRDDGVEDTQTQNTLAEKLEKLNQNNKILLGSLGIALFLILSCCVPRGTPGGARITRRVSLRELGAESIADAQLGVESQPSLERKKEK